MTGWLLTFPVAAPTITAAAQSPTEGQAVCASTAEMSFLGCYAQSPAPPPIAAPAPAPAPASHSWLTAGLLALGAVALTAVNGAQFGADPLTDGAEALDIGALADTVTTDDAGTAEDAADGDPVEQGCGESFTGGTKILLASGAAIPISQIKPGDKVLATNTRTGKTTPETVTAVMVKRDTDRYDLTIRSGPHTAVIDTTRNHLFWDASLHHWVAANKLSKGGRLQAPDGQQAVADGGTTPKVRDGWMWDLTIQNDHDFYIDTAITAVLVHNCAARMPSWEEWEQNNDWDGSYTDDDGNQTPGNNQVQNKSFDYAVQQAEAQLGRSLSDDEVARLHIEISGEGLGVPSIIERAITLYGGGGTS
ncbi:MAG TPA: Hint domain-containing protein [Streptosporangiaceae bacterium]